MHARSSGEALQTPETLDIRFGIVAGLYVAALIAPALLLVVVEWLHLRSEPLALGLLGVVGMSMTAIVAWQVIRRGEFVVWANSTWLALLVPAIGVLPMVAYFVPVVKFIAYSLTDLQAENAASLIGVIGFILGILASCLGGALVLMARARLVSATVDDSDVVTEWTAGWSSRDRFKLLIGVLLIGGALCGLISWQLEWLTISVVLPVGLILIFAVQSLVSKRTYRVTPAGLERHRDGRPFGSHQVIVWSRFEGFSVTDRAIVLHRQFPTPDIRFSRRDLSTDEADVTAALEAYIERRNSSPSSV